jgi:hypothetical protein
MDGFAKFAGDLCKEGDELRTTIKNATDRLASINSDFENLVNSHPSLVCVQIHNDMHVYDSSERLEHELELLHNLVKTKRAVPRIPFMVKAGAYIPVVKTCDPRSVPREKFVGINQDDHRFLFDKFYYAITIMLPGDGSAGMSYRTGSMDLE